MHTRLHGIHSAGVSALVILTTTFAASAWGQLFQPAPASPVLVGPAPNAPVMAAVGDFNNDGNPDIVTANPGNGTFSILFGNGAAGFTLAPGSPVTTPAPNRLAVTDYNRDSKADIAVAEVSGGFHVRAGNADGTFAGVLGLGGLSMSFRLATADFNNDNLPDYVATSQSGTYRVGFGTAGGGINVLGNLVTFATGDSYVATGDFNNDRNIDIVLAAGTTVYSRRGDGALSFSAIGTANAGGTVAGIASGDFNNDGNRDVAVIRTDSKVAILLGNGANGFTAAAGSPFDIGLVPSDIAVADLDNDGRLDLAIPGSAAGGIAVLGGNGSGGFAALPGSPFAAPNASSIAIADVDFDGKLDLIAADTPNRSVRVLLNKMPRIYWIPTRMEFFSTLGETAAKVIGGSVFSDTGAPFFDLNSAAWLTAGDGCTGSCLFANPNGLQAGVYEAFSRPWFNGGHSTPVRATLHVTKPAGGITSTLNLNVAGNPRGVTGGDFNGDGKADFAVSSPNGNSITVFLGDGAGAFTAAPGGAVTVGTNPEALIAADFNRDGKLDLATANTGSNDVSILLGLGNGTFGPLPALTYAVATLPAAITSADFNGDGYPDLATTSYSGAAVNVLLGNGFGGFNQAPGSPMGGRFGGKSIAVGDFNGDGKLDLANGRDAGVDILLGDGKGSFTATGASPLTAFSGAFWVSVTDLNADGKEDLVVARRVFDIVATATGNGDGSFAAAVPVTVPATPEWLAIDDMNGDGVPDVVISHGTKTMTVLKGPINATDQFALGSFGGGAVITADFNGDGTRDIATVNQLTQAQVLFSGSPVPSLDLTLQNTTIDLNQTNDFTATATVANAFDYATGNIRFTVTPFQPAPNSVAVTRLTSPLRYRSISTYTGKAAGTNTVTARYLGDTRFSPSADNAKDFTVSSGNLALNGTATRSTTVGTSFPGVFAVRVTNSSAQPVAGFQVVFTPAAGASVTLQSAGGIALTGGAIAAITDAQGIASVTATAGNVAGTYGLGAQSRWGTSATINFQLTVLPGTAAGISVQSGSGQAAQMGAAFGQPLRAKVADALGNGISGVTVTFTVPPSGASATLASPTAVTDSAGVASVSATANNAAGTYLVTASASGVPGSAAFTLTNGASAGAPAFIVPANNATVTSTIISFQWTLVPTAQRYELRVIEASTPQQFRVELLGSSATNAIYTLPSGNYRAEIRSCDASGCSAPGITNFVIAGGSVPTVRPAGVSCTVVNDANQNRLNCSWTALAGAHFYFVNVVQPNTGPGGGALTVAGQQVGTNSISVLIPNGQASVLVRGCTGDGCGPFSSALGINPAIGNPTVPILGEPFAGSSVDAGSNAPQITFSWNRVAGDNGSNFLYRLYVQDFSRNAPALDVLTTSNFYAAYFNPGTRYDALVIATPVGGGVPRQGPPSAFLTRGRVPKSPVVTAPVFGSTVSRDGQGQVTVTWTPLVNSDGTVSTRNYQYYFAGPGQPVSGVTPLTSLPLTLAPGSWLGTMRACTTGTSCTAGSETGWGPWNNQAGSEGGMASFTVQ